MYMKRLKEFSENNPDKLPPIGYELKSYVWLAVLEDSKTIKFIQNTNKRTKRLIPAKNRSGKAVKPALLTDKAQYVFILDKENNFNKSCQTAYINLLKKCIEETNSESLKQIYEVLNSNSYVLPEEMKQDDVVIFRIGEDYFPHEEQELRQFWEKEIEPEGDEKKRCHICGKEAPVLKRHTLKFLIGSERTALISANEKAYMSYGLLNSEVAPTCFSCEQKYGQALSYLLRKHTSRELHGGPNMFSISDVTYVYWTRNQNKDIETMMGLLTEPNPDGVKYLMTSPFTAKNIHAQANDFSLLALSSNKARLVVREYIEKPTYEVILQIRQFFKAQEINSERPYSIYHLVSTMYKEPRKEMQKYAVEEWTKWALNGNSLSGRILLPILKRIQKEGKMNVLHAAAIKSWLVSQKKEEWTVALDLNRNDAPYVCGRLFALLEKIQTEAIQSNDTISSRFFASASTTPNSIFGMLIRKSQTHISKIEKTNQKFALNYSIKMQEIMALIERFPAVLDLQEQATFALGYYHQKQDFYKKKEELV